MGDETVRKYRTIRVSEDRGDKLVWLADVADVSVADLVDEIAGAEIDRRFERIRDAVEAVKAARAETPVPTHELGGES